MPLTKRATLTGKTGPGVSVSSFVIEDIRGYMVNFDDLNFTVTKRDGSTESVDLSATGSVTITTTITKTTTTYTVVCSVA